MPKGIWSLTLRLSLTQSLLHTSQVNGSWSTMRCMTSETWGIGSHQHQSLAKLNKQCSVCSKTRNQRAKWFLATHTLNIIQTTTTSSLLKRSCSLSLRLNTAETTAILDPTLCHSSVEGISTPNQFPLSSLPFITKTSNLITQRIKARLFGEFLPTLIKTDKASTSKSIRCFRTRSTTALWNHWWTT